jgi:hypothetical protein
VRFLAFEPPVVSPHGIAFFALLSGQPSQSAFVDNSMVGGTGLRPVGTPGLMFPSDMNENSLLIYAPSENTRLCIAHGDKLDTVADSSMVIPGTSLSLHPGTSARFQHESIVFTATSGEKPKPQWVGILANDAGALRVLVSSQMPYWDGSSAVGMFWELFPFDHGIVFGAVRSDRTSGVYMLRDSRIDKIVATGDRVDGKFVKAPTPFNLRDGRLLMGLSFEDGGQGIFFTPLPGSTSTTKSPSTNPAKTRPSSPR